METVKVHTNIDTLSDYEPKKKKFLILFSFLPVNIAWFFSFVSPNAPYQEIQNARQGFEEPYLSWPWY